MSPAIRDFRIRALLRCLERVGDSPSFDAPSQVPVKAAVEHVRTGLGASNPGVRSASLSLAGVLYLHLGPSLRTLLEGEKASLLQLLDAELQKVGMPPPPSPSRPPIEGGHRAMPKMHSQPARLLRPKGSSLDFCPTSPWKR